MAAMEEEEVGDRYVPLPDAEIRGGQGALAEMRRSQPGGSIAAGAQPYSVRLPEYAADPARHLVQSTAPITPWLMPDIIGNHEAFERVALSMGMTPDDLLRTPAQTFGDVLNVVRHHHQSVTLAEIKSMQTKIEANLYALGRELLAVQAELQQVGSEAREVQRQQARRSVVLGGFGKRSTPAHRTQWLLKALAASKAIKQYVWEAMWLDLDDVDEQEPVVLNLLHGLPTAVRRAAAFSDITMVEFASVDVRMAFLS